VKMDYFKDLGHILSDTIASGMRGESMTLDAALRTVIGLIDKLDTKANKLIFIGNGGSASIASHMATDFLKNALIPAISFNDPSLLTCLGNDLGYEQIFAKPIEMLASKGDILFSISSSGASKNILNAVAKARELGCAIVTLSGFDKNNPLRKTGDLNIYVPSGSYGYVEIAHLAVCHCIVDRVMEDNR